MMRNSRRPATSASRTLSFASNAATCPDIPAHANADRYAGQRIFVVRRDDYVLLGAVRRERADGHPKDDHPEYALSRGAARQERSLWAITFPGTTRSLALLFERRDEMKRPFWSGWPKQRD